MVCSLSLSAFANGIGKHPKKIASKGNDKRIHEGSYKAKYPGTFFRSLINLSRQGVQVHLAIHLSVLPQTTQKCIYLNGTFSSKNEGRFSQENIIYSVVSWRPNFWPQWQLERQVYMLFFPLFLHLHSRHYSSAVYGAPVAIATTNNTVAASFPWQ